MRLFVGLDIAESIRDRIRTLIDNLRQYAPNVRWVTPESLHITFKFIGELPEARVREVESALRAISLNSLQVSFRSAGFFPTPRSARVFWIGIEAEPALSKLAQMVEARLEEIGIPRENRDFSPHLTLARAGSGSPTREKTDRPNQRFSRLIEYLATIPRLEFGTMTAQAFLLYRSQLSSRGSTYTKLASFALEAQET